MLAPVLIAVAGIPGSGKTTIGRAAARLLGAALLDLDVLTNPLLQRLSDAVGADGFLGHPALGGATRRARYECLAGVAADLLTGGLPVVAVAPFTDELAESPQWQAFCALAHAPTALLVQVQVPAEVAVDRRRRRGLPRDLAEFTQQASASARTGAGLDAAAQGAAPGSAAARAAAPQPSAAVPSHVDLAVSGLDSAGSARDIAEVVRTFRAR